MQAEVNYIQHQYSLPYSKGYTPPTPSAPRRSKADTEGWNGIRVDLHPPRGTIISFPRQGKILVQGGIQPAVEEPLPALRVPVRPSRRLLAFTTLVGLSAVALLLPNSPQPLAIQIPALPEVESPTLLPGSAPRLLPSSTPRLITTNHETEPRIDTSSKTSIPPKGKERPSLKFNISRPHQDTSVAESESSPFNDITETTPPSFQLHTAYQNLVDEDGWQVSDPRFGIAAHWRSGTWSAEASYLPSQLGPADLRTYEGDAFVNNLSAFVRAEGKDGRFRAYAIRQETLSEEWYRDDLIASDGTARISASVQPWYKVGYLNWGEQSKRVMGGDVGVLVGKSDPGEVKLVVGRSRNTTWSDAGGVLLDSYTRTDFRRSPYAETGVTHHTYYPMQFQPWSESLERTTVGVGVRTSPHSSGGLLYQTTSSRDQLPTSKGSDGASRTKESRTHGVQLVWRYNPSDTVSLDLDSSIAMDEAKGDIETKQAFSLKFKF